MTGSVSNLVFLELLVPLETLCLILNLRKNCIAEIVYISGAGICTHEETEEV